MDGSELQRRITILLAEGDVPSSGKIGSAVWLYMFDAYNQELQFRVCLEQVHVASSWKWGLSK